MQARRVKSFFVIALIVVFAALLGGYSTLAWMRHSSIESVCAIVQAAHTGDRIVALVDYVESDGPSLKEKNRAVWVLGELRDERSLPALKGLLVSRECDHNRFVCQREVTKAIRKITGETPNPYPFDTRKDA